MGSPADIEAKDLSGAVSGDRGRDHDSHRHHLATLAGLVADVQVGRIQVDRGKIWGDEGDMMVRISHRLGVWRERTVSIPVQRMATPSTAP